MDLATFESKRKFVETPSGRISYVENGEGVSALFVHGLLLNGYLWRHQLEGLADRRRCIAVDLLAHGSTEIKPTQDVSFSAQANMLAQFLDALTLEQVDLVSNDSGSGIAQIFAANYPQRVRSLTLTNGDTHDNWPPQAASGIHDLAAQGRLADAFRAWLSHKNAFFRGLGIGYEHPQDVAEETIEAYLRPFLSNPQRIRDLERFILSFDNKQTVSVESKLKDLKVPTLIVWGTGDIFFDVKWSHWLASTIPGTRRRVEFDGARLFFPEERWQEFNDELRRHWKEVA